MKFPFAVVCLSSALCFAQQTATQASAPQSSSDDMHDMSMPGHDMSKMSSQSSGEAETHPAETGAMHAMEGHDMDMGPHMKMTALRPALSGDAARAGKIVASARAIVDKYADYHTALNDGFKIFLPRIPQKQYHFTNYANMKSALSKFDPDKPTSLLYEKDGDAYRIVGVMYTASKSLGEDDLNQLIPLSVAQWHEHVNFCVPPLGQRWKMLLPHSRFGLNGSIATQEECDATGGKFYPVILDWMVHVYPLEKETNIWSVDHQHQHED